MDNLKETIEQEELENDRRKLTVQKKNVDFNYNVWVGEFFDEHMRKYHEMNDTQTDMVYKVMNFVERKLK